MPYYYSRGVAVRLSAWAHPTCWTNPFNAAKPGAEIADKSSEFECTRQHTALHNMPILEREDLGLGSATSWKEEKLKEEYCEEHCGTFFLDNETPSYLVHAFKPGVESDSTTPHRTESQKIAAVGPEESRRLSELPHHSPSSAACLDQFLETDELNSETTDEHYFVHMPHRASRSIDPSHGVPEISSELEAALKPLEVSVYLSENSFRDVFQTSHCFHDICINVFYNGELASSRVMKYSPLLAQGWNQRVSFTGRRSETHREIPWMIFTGAPTIGEHDNFGGGRETSMSASRRWGKLSELLITEADRWGRLKNGSRGIVGNYLELLSKETMPQALDKTACGGKEYGVIDVLIGYGHASSPDLTAALTSPSRRLPEQMKNANAGESSKYMAENAGKSSDGVNAPKSAKTSSTAPTPLDISKQQDRSLLPRTVEKPRIVPVPPRQLSYLMSKNIPQKRYREPSPDPEECEATQRIVPKDIPTATPQSTGEYWTSSTLIQPTNDELICERDAVIELPDEETSPLVSDGSHIIEASEPTPKASQKSKYKYRKKLIISPKEIKLLLESPILNGININSNFARGRTRRATQSMREIATNTQGACPSLSYNNQELVEAGFAIDNDKIPSQGIKSYSPTKVVRPGSFCKDSILTYPTNKCVMGFEMDAITGQVYKAVTEENDEYFETEGLLMGTRYVVTGKK